jgi:hypothetical protein
VTPTADDFRALARSAPWLWSTLHFTCRSREGAVEAWLRRPGELLVRDDGRAYRVSGPPYPLMLVSNDPDLEPPSPVPPGAVEPVRRGDGLVVGRPADPEIEYGDPMYANYQWVAMLDPVELSHHTTVDGVRAGERAGRPTWEARMTAVEGYDPCCGCCPLLWSEVSDRVEYGDGDPAWTPRPGTSYPEAYDVALDRGTGVVVGLEAIGGQRPGVDLEVEIHRVDTDLSDVLG